MTAMTRTRPAAEAIRSQTSVSDRMRFEYAQALLYLVNDLIDPTRCGLPPCPDILSRQATEGDMLRALAELADRIDCLHDEIRPDCDLMDPFGNEDGHGNPRPPLHRYPHLRREAGPRVCPLCASERSETEVVATGKSAWLCEACGNDPAEAERVMLRQRKALRRAKERLMKKAAAASAPHDRPANCKPR